MSLDYEERGIAGIMCVSSEYRKPAIAHRELPRIEELAKKSKAANVRNLVGDTSPMSLLWIKEH